MLLTVSFSPVPATAPTLRSSLPVRTVSICRLFLLRTALEKRGVFTAMGVTMAWRDTTTVMTG